MTVAYDVPDVVPTPAEIPSADFSQPFENHTIFALRWWLLCRGMIICCLENASSKHDGEA